MKIRISAVAVALALTAPLSAQPPQTVQDEYAVYDLLSPETASFRTVYEVAVTTPGATMFPDRIGTGLTTATWATFFWAVLFGALTPEALPDRKRASWRIAVLPTE